MIFDEASQGRVYTSNQFAESFEGQAGLGANRTINERIAVHATKGDIKFFRNPEDYNLPVDRYELLAQSICLGFCRRTLLANRDHFAVQKPACGRCAFHLAGTATCPWCSNHEGYPHLIALERGLPRLVFY
jgi:hypothetical protein